MKRILSLMLMLVILTSAFVGCGSGNAKGTDTALPDWMSGSDAARLLLANERLNAQLLKNEGDIFENGVEVMNSLAEIAVTNLNLQYVGDSSPSVTKLSSFTNTAVLEDDCSGKVEIDGDTVVWSEFEEYNNSYDYFKSITDNIVTAAEIGAQLIDDVKKNVRVVDKWIDIGGIHYYLYVEENSEVLYEKDTYANLIKICRRYKNEDGRDVYELYRNEGGYEERMTYIPGERYELSMITDFGEDYFVADNSKGYWENYIVGAFPTHYNVSYFIMKNDICYDAFYDPKTESTTLLKIMSSDKATDILSFCDYEDSSLIELKFNGFDGIESVEAPADDVDILEGKYANLLNWDNVKIHLTNGKTLNYSDLPTDGEINIIAIPIGYIGGFGYIGDICLLIRGETYAERLEKLKSFLNENGLRCRRNIDSVFNGIDRAYVDLESVIKYYTWNGISVIDEAGIGKAIDKEKARFSDMEALYKAIKDAEVLDFSDTELIELNIKFAPIAESGFENITLDAMKVSVGSISLTVEDTTLYVNGEPYKVAFALANSTGGLVHFDVENTSSTKYTGEDKFTVNASALEFTLPVLSSGDYTLVAYIATLEGIRASAYTPTAVNEVINMPMNIDNMTVSAEKKGENDALTFTYERIKDFTVTLTTPLRIGYEEFKTLVSEKAFEYGTPSDIIEVSSGDTYTALTGNETEIAYGMYRISYNVENGDSVSQGYIYVQYSCQ